jgi:Uma2 family endonuclease
MNLAAPLTQHVKAKKLGVVFGAETGFKLERNPDTVLAPDIAFLSRARIGKLNWNYYEGAPDLAVEVASPGESRQKIDKKTQLWLELGVLSLWNVYPQAATVSIHRPGCEPTVLSGSDVLCGNDTVPGFQISLREIFDLGSV